MALSDILRAIEEEADAEIRQIDLEAERRIRVELAHAGEAADRVRADELRRRELAVAEESRRILTGARVEADRAVREAREQVYQSLLSRVRARLAAVSETAEYARVLPLLFDECRRILPDARLLRVRPEDADRATAIAIESGLADVEVDAGLSTMGGLEMTTADGRRVLNTFEDRLDKADPHLRLLTGDLVPGMRGSGS